CPLQARPETRRGCGRPEEVSVGVIIDAKRPSKCGPCGPIRPRPRNYRLTSLQTTSPFRLRSLPLAGLLAAALCGPALAQGGPKAQTSPVPGMQTAPKPTEA